MHRSGGRLGVAVAMSRHGHLEPMDNSNQAKASTTKAEKEIKALKLENQRLKHDLTDIRSLYKQLIGETAHEKFDERRVTLLKSQVIQLDRQILLLNEALSSRAEVLLEVENNLQWMADKCRSYICQDSRGAQVSIDRSDLMTMVETAESARLKLYKQLENNTTQRLARPIRFYSEFLQADKAGDLTLLDVASGNLDHINLKHVTKLETKLSTVYRELLQLHCMLEEDSGVDHSTYLWSSGHVSQAVRERLMTQILKSCARMKDCSSDLLELSILYPSAPWPPLKRCALKDITAERVLQNIPSVTLRSRSQDTHQLIQALVKAYNYKVYMLNNKNQALREEVKYHQKVYNLQLKYTESLFQAIREAYSGFEEMSNEVIVKPLKEVLDAYLVLNQTASELSLKKFLQTFKDQVPQLSDIVETIAVKEGTESDGSKVLSQYGEEFFQALEKLVKDHQLKRDREANKMEDIRAEQKKLDNELADLLTEPETGIQQSVETSPAVEGKSQTTITSTQNDSQNDKFIPEFVQKKEVDVPERNSFLGEGDNGHFCDRSKNYDNEKHRQKAKSLHKKEWTSVLDDQPVSKPEFINTKVKQPLHKKEWVNVLEADQLERSVSDLSLGHPNSDLSERDISASSRNKSSRMPIPDDESHMTDAELFAYHQSLSEQSVLLSHENHAMQFSDNSNKDVSQNNAINSEANVTNNHEPSLHGLPPSNKLNTKKKLNYVPNTFVPNRTLQLRRSGSLNRLSTDQSNILSQMDGEVTLDQYQSTSNIEKQSRCRSREGQSKEMKNNTKSQRPFKSKPAFR